jgi:predicted aldo/keto reductase-like oxidoreductase
MAKGFRGNRHRVLLAAHLGSTNMGGQYCKTRVVKRCETSFLDSLHRLETDHVEVLHLHNFNVAKDWDKAERSGFLELAVRLRDQGRAQLLGMSGHYHGILERAVDSGLVDLIMMPVNLFNHAMPGRGDLLDLCAKNGVAVIAMKPFGGGKLLNRPGSQRVPKYMTSGEAFQVQIPRQVTPEQCLTYVLAQPGVTVALPGVKNGAELSGALRTLEASEDARDYGSLLAGFGRYVEGECTYCNHCLPCPEVIDIGQVNRLLDIALQGLRESVMSDYAALSVKASTCTGCGVCTKRCPFGVDVVPRMRVAAEMFEMAVA